MEKRLAGNPLAMGGMNNKVVSDLEAATRKGKKTKKVIRLLLPITSHFSHGQRR